MFLSKIQITGYRALREKFTASFHPGVTVLVGENASGKSTIIDAVRLMIGDYEGVERAGISDSDFHRSIVEPAKTRGVNHINIRCEFENLSNEARIAFLPWLDATKSGRAFLNLEAENKGDSAGRIKRNMWGGESTSSLFEWDLLDSICCIYLPALRDAEEKLKGYKGSRLKRLLKSLHFNKTAEEQAKLEDQFNRSSKQLLSNSTIKEADHAIRQYLGKALGPVFGQDTSIQFSESNFDRIIERLRVLFYPRLSLEGGGNSTDLYRELHENSLGYNNLIYLATVMAELEALNVEENLLKLLLIEEPEAHLHPQLQIRLLRYLEKEATDRQIQIIITSHSPVIAASVDLHSICVMTPIGSRGFDVADTLQYCQLSECGFSETSKFFLQRWLDVTKSTLLFAKGVILVEGIAEALILPELAKLTLANKSLKGKSLDDYGVSIINMNGKYLNHFLQLFNGYSKDDAGNFVSRSSLPVRCSGITDCDPEAEMKPTASNPCECKNKHVTLKDETLSHSKNSRVFTNLKTFEYDLALTGLNIVFLYRVFIPYVGTDGMNKKIAQQYIDKDWGSATEEEKADAAFWFLKRIESSKGEFAQELALELSKNSAGFTVPQYVEDAIIWAVNEEPRSTSE